MAQINSIKINQIDTGQLLSFIQSGLGVQLGVNSSAHSYNETFSGTTYFSGNIVAAGASTFGPSTFTSGLVSNTGISVIGNISGKSLTIDNFSLPSGIIKNISIGSMMLTGVPIYDSGFASVAAALPSGTVYGIKQIINAPQLEIDISGNYMPATGIGTSVAMLCVSLGF